MKPIQPASLTILWCSIIFFGLAMACSKKDSNVTGNNPPPAPAAKPSAAYSVVIPQDRAPVKIKFQNNSKNAASYLWDFGDGTTSSEAAPEKVFMKGGTFPVKLVAKKNNDADSIVQQITVKDISPELIIKSIEITSLKLTGWDEGIFEDDEPEVFVKVKKETHTIFTSSVNNSVFSLPVSYNSNKHVLLAAPIPDLTIEVWDEDIASSDDLMGSVTFKIRDFMTLANHYPETVQLTHNDLTIKLSLEWK